MRANRLAHEHDGPEAPKSEIDCIVGCRRCACGGEQLARVRDAGEGTFQFAALDLDALERVQLDSTRVSGLER
jgi:hypothetical protein